MPYDIYTRVSEIGGRGGDSFGSPEEQEAACRAYATARGWEVDEVVYEGDVSGSTPVDARDLGRLIRKCESGESEGVLCRHLDRFGRNMVEGMLAYKRLDACGARLVAVADGIDSTDPGAKTLLGFRLVMAEETFDRNRAARMNGKQRAVERGVYAAPAPFGYSRDDEGRLQPNGDADAVREIFRRRAAGEGFSSIARDIPLTRSGIRRVVMNRAYVGEQRIPHPTRKGEPQVVANSHVPLVSEAEWQAANAVKGHAPVRRGLSEQVALKGVVRCATCGHSMAVLTYGKNGVRDRLTYACTRRGCGAASIAVQKVEPPILAAVSEAVRNDEPHVAAVLANDDRYEAALKEVTDAQAALAEYRDNIELQQVLGIQDFAAGLRTRREALEVARRALRNTPRPEGLDAKPHEVDNNNLGAEYERWLTSTARRVLAEVLVFPKSQPVRLALRWVGAEAHAEVPEQSVAKETSEAA